MTSTSAAYDLQARWKRRTDAAHSDLTSGDKYCELAKAMLASGMPLQALELAQEGCQRWSDDLYLAQIRGLALARSRATQAAAAQLTEVVQRLRQQTAPDLRLFEEASGALARTEKDFALQSSDAALRIRHLERSAELYEEAYRSTGGYWTGINVATLSTLLGQPERAQAVAQRLYRECSELLVTSNSDNDRYWLLATLGEAALNLQQWSQAEQWYGEAASVAGRRYGDLRSSQRHVELLLEHFGQDASLAKAWLPLPRVAVFTGHIVDAPDRASPRCPSAIEDRLRQAILRWIIANGVAIGYSSAACGSDILFLETLQERGGETHIILPFAEETFVQTSVDIGATGNWVERFWRVLEGAAGIIRISRDRTDLAPLAYSYANQIIAGTGRINSADLGTELIGLAVWDGQNGGRGGTGDAVRTWLDCGIAMSQIRPLRSSGTDKPEFSDPHSLEAAPIDAIEHRNSVVPAEEESGDTRVMSLLFADAVGFSQLGDREIRLFITEYLKRVADLIAQYNDCIAVRETAGDGLYLAFTTLESAGCCALDLAEMVERTAWESLGFSIPLRLRVALHAGPVILSHDPITGLPKGVGSHVSRAARLEPKTPPGQVYASEAFAALAQLETKLPFHCRYVKQLEWAKRYGTFPTFLLSRN